MVFLIVDDNEISMSVEKIVLEDCGITVMTAGSGKMALRLSSENIFDMIFMDIQMPGMDGYETAELIRKFDESVPIIALSAYEISTAEERFARSGITAAIQKPLNKDSVQALIERFTSGSVRSADHGAAGTGVWDRDRLLASIRSEEAAVRILRQFLKLHKQTGRKLSSHVAEGDLYAARRIMHDILGQAENLCCHRLHEIALQLDVELKQGRWDSLQAFLQTWRAVRREMKEFCTARETQETEPAADWDALKAELLSLCQSFDIRAAELVETQKAVFAARMAPEAFAALKNAVAAYDFPYLIDNLEGLYVSSSVG